MTVTATAPRIIRRKKIIAHGHNSGGWKVAYADFVTAMMAFFLLLWLLGSTSEDQRKGLADYFNPSIPINRVSGGGSGSFGGDSVFSDQKLAQSGTGAAQAYHADNDKSHGVTGVSTDSAGDAEGDAEAQKLSEIENLLTGQSGESMVSPELARHIVTRVTDEGLIVELFDLPGATLFEGDSLRPTPLLGDLVRVVARVFALADNGIALSGHVPSHPVVRIDRDDWDLSTRRAQAVRAMARGEGLQEARFQRVTGHADRALVVANPMSLRNSRIELTLLR